MLTHLEKHGVRVKLSKCQFFQSSVEYLGHRIDQDGLHPTDEKVAAINKAPEPKNVTELKSFLGLRNYYSCFLQNSSTILHPLHNLLRKEATVNPLILACIPLPAGSLTLAGLAVGGGK